VGAEAGQEGDIMTRGEFVTELEIALRRSARPFDQRQVNKFVEAMWPLIDLNPNPEFWAETFWRSQPDQTETG
jgi:hypothetical protein